MRRRVLKYPLDENLVQLPWPEGAKVVLVAAQFGTLTVWIEMDAELTDTLRRRWFAVHGTGHPIDGDEYEYAGSAVVGAYVWHVYAGPVQ